MTETLYQYLPTSSQRKVDQIVANMRGEPWPTRFLYLFGWLYDRLEKRTNSDPSLLLQQSDISREHLLHIFAKQRDIWTPGHEADLIEYSEAPNKK